MMSAQKRLMAAINAAVVEGKPAKLRTVAAVASAAQCSVAHASRLIPELHTWGLLHIDGWHRIGRAGVRSASYAPGAGEDVPYPEAHAKGFVDWRTAPSGVRIAKWLKNGNQGGTTAVMKPCFVSRQTGRCILNAMHADGVIRIYDFVRQWGGKAQPLYMWRGPDDHRPDAEPLKPLGITERRNLRKQALKKQFGTDISKVVIRAMYGEAPKGATVMVNGKPIYARGKGVLVRPQQNQTQEKGLS
jgi:hypothetical protein